jgi:amino acid adenylation domain-containing protein
MVINMVRSERINHSRAGGQDQKLTDWQVVVNHEEQYSIWPAHRPPPAGWRAEGPGLSRDQCLDHIAAVWTDMRPRGLRGENPETAVEPWRDLADLILGQAASTPAATAIVSGDTRLSYRELSDRAAQLAHHLRSLHVRSGSVVGVALERSADQLVAALAIMLAGGVYLPLDCSYPAQRLAVMLEETAPHVLISRSDLPAATATGPGAAEGSGSTVLVDHEAERLSEYPTEPPNVSRRPDDVAYIIFTSGSTGRPKAVMNTRRGLLNRLLWQQRVGQLGPEDAVLQVTPLGFDVSVEECYWPLLAGARIVVAGPDGNRDPRYLSQLIRAEQATVVHFVPSVLQVFLETASLQDCRSLRLVIAGGEVLSADLQRRFFASGLEAELENIYGPAEAAIVVSQWSCRRDWTSATIPIGHPIGGVRIYVLSPDGTLVAAGADGEIYIGGVQVARGYLGRPAQTAERFVPDPFAAEPGSRLYRSGDRARYRPDGALEFLGRMDEQIKLRGVRIEPGEVEAVISAAPGVRACAVAAAGTGVDAVLVAWIVGDAEPSQVRRHVAGILPPAMVPARFVQLAALPLSPNGKLDRAALPSLAAPDNTGSAPDDTSSAPDDTGRQLTAIWGEVLGLPPIGLDQPLADLGAHSLQAARILARIQTRLAAVVSLNEVFLAETIAGLAQLIDSRRGQPNGQPNGQLAAAQLPRLRHDVGTPARISPGQRRLWFLDHLSARGGTAYNVPVAVRLRGFLDVPALRAAVGDLVDRHEQLRTCFPLTDGGPAARVVDEPVYPAVPVIDLTGYRRVDDALKLAGQLAAAHFDLAQAPLLRWALFRIAPDDHLLVTVYHHMIADGWTVDIFDRDLAEAYQSRVAGEPSALPGLDLEYRDFARWQDECAAPPGWESQLGWWRRQLTGAPVTLDLPADRCRPAAPGYRGARMIRPVPAGLLGQIQRLAATTRTTPYAVCVTAFGLLIRELCGQRDVLVASPAAGRPDPALDHVAGFFATTLPVRLRSGEESFGACVRSVHALVMESLEHQYVPFERLVAEFVPSRDLAYPPLVQVALAYQGPRRPHARLAGLAAEPVAIDNGTAKFDLTIEVSEVGEELEAVIEYSTDLFDTERADGMLARFLDIVSGGAQNPDTAVPDLIAERRPERSDRCLHEIFAGTAGRFPDRIAVSDGQRQLMYAELDQAANRLAHRLRRLGAGPGQLVGLCAERTVDLVVGVLAVLKSGAGYLPLDPGHPPARQQFMLQDAGCRLLLGDGDDGGDGGDRERDQALGRSGVTFVPLADPAAETGSPEAAPVAGARPHDIAYVIYTSGSTGTPKGVAVTHANVARLFAATADDFAFGPDDVWAFFHSIAFDFSVWELWGPLLHGGRLVVVPYLTSRDPAAVLELLQRAEVTVLNQTPTAFRQLAVAAEEAGFPPLRLRLVVFGGEALNPASLRGWIAGYGLARPRLVNMYGITETTVHVTIHQITLADIQASASPIGRPIGDLDVHVLDEELNEVPAGTEGEMYIGGPGVALGYHQRRALTAERFVADPFGPPGSRLYRSGDLAVRHPGGALEYRGRRDDQVKLHGFRIELGEIERVLLDQPGVREAACMLREDTPGQVRLVAYLVAEVIAPAELRTAAAAVLPAHMVPAIFVGVPSLPVTANGKLDRSRLPRPPAGETEAAAGPDPATPTATAMERALCNVWSRVLGTDVRDIGANFFALGGDSIIAIRLAAEIRAAGSPVSIEQIFRYPTIGALAAQCDQRAAGPVAPGVAGSVAVAVPVSLSAPDPDTLPADVTSAYPMTAMQLGIMYECELAESPDAAGLYQDLASGQLEGRLDRAALGRALATITARHDILRTSFDLASLAEPMQLVHREARIPVTESSTAGADAWWHSQRSVPFDLTTAPLVRCHVTRRSPESFELSFLVHHIALDGWSVARLMTELLLEYDRQLGGAAHPEITAPQVRFRDFVAAERAAIADPGAQAFWRDVATAPEPARLPALGQALPFEVEIPADLDAGLQRVARDLGLPLKSIFFAAHLWALHTLTGQPDVASGLQVNGRPDRQDADQVLGLMLNVVPVRATVIGGTWADLARLAFAAEQECQRYRRFPLARIQAEAGPGRRLFEAVFNYTDFHVLNDLCQLADIHCRDLSFYDLHTFPLLVEVIRSLDQRSRKIAVSAGVGSELAATGARAGELIVHALRDIAGNPNGRENLSS